MELRARRCHSRHTAITTGAHVRSPGGGHQRHVQRAGDRRGELAVEVVDRWQGCGAGTQLLQAVRDRAAEVGYRELVGEMLVVNAATHAALRRVFLITQVRRDGSELTITVPVDGEPAPASPVEGLVA